MKPDILYNSKEYFDNLPSEEFTALLDEFGFEYEIIDENNKQGVCTMENLNVLRSVKGEIKFSAVCSLVEDDSYNDSFVLEDVLFTLASSQDNFTTELENALIEHYGIQDIKLTEVNENLHLQNCKYDYKFYNVLGNVPTVIRETGEFYKSVRFNKLLAIRDTKLYK